MLSTQWSLGGILGRSLRGVDSPGPRKCRTPWRKHPKTENEARSALLKSLIGWRFVGPGTNTDTKLLIYGLFQKGGVLAQDGIERVV